MVIPAERPRTNRASQPHLRAAWNSWVEVLAPSAASLTRTRLGRGALLAAVPAAALAGTVLIGWATPASAQEAGAAALPQAMTGTPQTVDMTTTLSSGVVSDASLQETPTTAGSNPTAFSGDTSQSAFGFGQSTSPFDPQPSPGFGSGAAASPFDTVGTFDFLTPTASPVSQAEPSPLVSPSPSPSPVVVSPSPAAPLAQQFSSDPFILRPPLKNVPQPFRLLASSESPLPQTFQLSKEAVAAARPYEGPSTFHVAEGDTYSDLVITHLLQPVAAASAKAPVLVPSSQEIRQVVQASHQATRKEQPKFDDADYIVPGQEVTVVQVPTTAVADRALRPGAYYVVERGDNLTTIGRRYGGLTVEQIVAANPQLATRRDLIHERELIRLPLSNSLDLS